MARPRQYDFDGDDASYIIFLESRVAQLEDASSSEARQSSPDEGNRSCSTTDNRRIHDRGDRDGQEGCELQIIEYQPDIHDSSSKDPNKSPPTTGGDEGGGKSKSQLRVEGEMDQLFSKIPAWDKWHNHIDEKIRLDFLINLLPDGNLEQSPISPQSAPSDIKSVVEDYEQGTKAQVTLNKQILHLRELVLVSLCVVALRLGHEELAYRTIRSYFGEKNDKQIDKLFSGAKWANSLISNLLSTTRWGLKSWDIFLMSR
ncbi:uncharacterized protein N7483_012386 [Penicillium malachiteum]|uniref:uncharacterized protein n=1 Tax=Penicillium malachiteum TaxID=1324776 RepID=UPI002547624A|nr:uncharacterized protein N7483_012386 [Penicillium malachiteum]KAJ5715205.1 hypothetical protein N7483_012386 [Penicillium malachiteum]